MSIRRCLGCKAELGYIWWEMTSKEEIPVAGEGGRIHARFMGQFCNPTCFSEWWNRYKSERDAKEKLMDKMKDGRDD